MEASVLPRLSARFWILMFPDSAGLGCGRIRKFNRTPCMYLRIPMSRYKFTKEANCTTETLLKINCMPGISGTTCSGQIHQRCGLSSRKGETRSDVSVAICAATTHTATGRLCRHSAKTHSPKKASVLSRFHCKWMLVMKAPVK